MASLGQASSSMALGFSSRTQQRAPKQLPIILPRPPPAPGLSLFCGSIVSGNVRSGFYGQGKQVVLSFSTASSSSSPMATMMMKPAIQFIRGIDEQTIPDVSLTRSRDGNNGVATFMFDQPSVFDSSRELGDITGLYLIDEEGMLQTVDVSAKFQNGRPVKIESKYVMRNAMEWDRFMRFMERYAEANGLGFVKK